MKQEKTKTEGESRPSPSQPQQLPPPQPSHPHNFSRGGILGFSILSLCVCLRHGFSVPPVLFFYFPLSQYNEAYAEL